MESTSHEKSSFNQDHLLIDHNIIDFKVYSASYLLCKNNENEKKLIEFISNKEKFKIESYDAHYKEISDFLTSKLEAMEKINLDDECFAEGENGIKKADENKNESPKSENSKKSKKSSNNSGKKMNKKNHKNNNKNVEITHEGKIEKPNMESIDLVDVVNIDVDKEIKEKELNKFFSNKTLLNSIIDEMKGK